MGGSIEMVKNKMETTIIGLYRVQGSVGAQVIVLVTGHRPGCSMRNSVTSQTFASGLAYRLLAGQRRHEGPLCLCVIG